MSRDREVYDDEDDEFIIKSQASEDRVAVHVYTGQAGDGVHNIAHHMTSRFESDEMSESDLSSPRRKLKRNRSLIRIGTSDDDEEEAEEPFVNTQNYFMAHNARVKTSNNTLNDIDLSALKITGCEPLNYLESSSISAQLMDTYESKLFQEMFFLLFEGANVLTHGFGSKLKLIESFTDKWLADEHSLIIYGFYPELTLKHIIGYFRDALGAEDSSYESVLEAATDLNYDLYVVIHSLDKLLSLSPVKLKQFLVHILSKADGRIRLIASLDHVHSGLLFSSKESNELNLVWIICPTFSSYSVERAYTNSVDSKNNAMNGQLSLSAIGHVYESLNPNAQKIFVEILTFHSKPTLQVAEKISRDKGTSDASEDDMCPESSAARSRDAEDGLAFSTLYRICREEYLVNSEITLRAQLTEFKDHKLIKFNKRSDGTQTITLLISKQLVHRFLEKLNDN
ncbi:Origin recognition complex subunit 2 [Halotydeus destructor]|nr:Origin recognition complex subunit 2 [Halotydeus destructor]